MNFIFLGIGIIIGAAVGLLAAKAFKKVVAPSIPLDQFNSLNNEKIGLVERLKATEEDRTKQAQQVTLQQNNILTLTKELAGAKSETTNLQSRLEEQKKFIEDLKKQMLTEFQNLAGQVLDAKSKIFSDKTNEHLDLILKPFKEKLGTFEKKVEETYTTEAKERHALKAEVGRLIELNQKISADANSLTNALTGNSKTQGDWGEMVLEKLLETAGLRQGHEYQAQKQHRDEEGKGFKPDFIVNLPDEKHIIIDSKVTLKSYHAFCKTDDGPVKDQCMGAFLESVNKHVTDLSGKHYQKLQGINSPDFVFMFMPIEPAYLLATHEDPELAMRAWNKGIAIVTASTLFTALKMVASIWRLENQNKNAQEIANEGAKLYDKFVGFLEEFERLGGTLDSSRVQYDTAMGRLKTGPGNVFKKIEGLRELGAAPVKRIRQELLD